MSIRRLNRAADTNRLGRFARDGTIDIVAGSLLAGFGAYAFQVWGARVLGAVDFAPLSQLMTVHFLAFAVVLLPIEQVVIRRLALDPNQPPLSAAAKLAIGLIALVAGAFVLAFSSRLFAGRSTFGFVAAATVLTHAVFAVARGHLAGRHRYRAYGLVSAAAIILRLTVVGAIIVPIGATAVGMAWALVLGPLIVLVWRPFSHMLEEEPQAEVDQSNRFLAGLVIAAAAAQTLLLAGTVVAGLLSNDEVVASIVFATFTVFRAPLVLGNNLLARVLPPFTAMAVSGEHARLRRWAEGLAAAGVIAAILASLVGGVVGPPVVELFFGEEFVITSTFAALVAAGVVLAGTGTFLNQVLLALGRTSQLAAAWLLALVAAALALALPIDDVAEKVGVAFLIGSIAATFALTYRALVYRPIAGDSRRYRLAKRALDIIGAGLLIIATAPAVLVIAMAVKAGSRGPVFFKQTRIGRGGKPFRMWKFRTMDHGADEAVLRDHLDRLAAAEGTEEEASVRLKLDDDPRITRVGLRLRHWSLDELPNLWSVLGGTMSLVGPRPLVPYEVELMEDGSQRRLAVKPGVTGLAQIAGRDEINMAARTRHDLEYLQTRSLELDLRILARTVITVFKNPGK